MAKNTLVSRELNNVNENKEGNNMTPKFLNEAAIKKLRYNGIPQKVIDEIATLKGLRRLVRHEKASAFTEIKGVGERRAEIIISVLKEALELAKKAENVRWQEKVSVREKPTGFNVNSFDREEIFRDVKDNLAEVCQWKPYFPHGESEAVQAKRRAANEAEFKRLLPVFNEICKAALERKAFTVRHSERRSIRLNASFLSTALGVDYEDRSPTTKLIVVDHSVQRMFNIHWRFFSPKKDIGQKLKDEFQKLILRRLGNYGVRVMYEDGSSLLYGGVASSAGHQKQEKLLMAESHAMRDASKFFYFGKSFEDFVNDATYNGAAYWKMRANLVRPNMKPFEFKDGTTLSVFKTLVVSDVEKVFKLDNARVIGDLEGGVAYKDGKVAHTVTLFDGMLVTLKELKFQGQLSGLGFKALCVDGSSSVLAACQKLGISVEEFMNTMVEGIDGKMHRVGDYDAICGEGCWKFDKGFSSYDAYLEWMRWVASEYPGMEQMWLLRQAEEIEEEKKIRRLTSSLIQQWMTMTAAEIRKLTKRAREGLKKDKTFAEAVRRMAGLNKEPEDRSDLEALIGRAPWLVMNQNVQEYLGTGWQKRQNEAISGKFRTEGQYPYICQDIVAAFECWIGRKDPNDPDLGILKGDEISCADVPDGKRVLCVRFPANFLTAKNMTNRACKEAFASVNGFAVLSVHSDILIRQDGDVDGDEMCVIYNKLAVELTDRMEALFHPPVIVFQHGSKAPKSHYENYEEFLNAAFDSLWEAKKFDSVGLYANLAKKCGWLASIHYERGETDKANERLLWMSAASTGAILAIDQVKGNAVSQRLIDWLDAISSAVRDEMAEIYGEEMLSVDAKNVKNTFNQYYVDLVKGLKPKAEDYAGECADSFMDQICGLIIRDTGSWDDFDNAGVCFNTEAANKALTDSSVPAKRMKGFVTKRMVKLLRDNWFKAAPKTEEEKAFDATLPTLSKMVPGTEIGLKELLKLLWRNEQGAMYRMDGKTLFDRKEEYVNVCRDILKLFLASAKWIANFESDERPVGYVFTEEEKWACLSNYVIRDGLEMHAKGGNGLPWGKGSYVMFCLRLFAKEALANVEKNGYDKYDFSPDGIPELTIDMEIDDIEEDIECICAFEADVVDTEEVNFVSEESFPNDPSADEGNFDASACYGEDGCFWFAGEEQ